MNEKCNFKRTSIKKIRDIFLRAIRKRSRNSSLEYTFPLGINENPNIKHYIRYDELKKIYDLSQKKEISNCLFYLEFFISLEYNSVHYPN